MSDGTLTVCADVPLEPFVVEDPGRPSGHGGFDVELLEPLAEELGLDLEVHAVSFEDIVSARALRAGLCDLGASGITLEGDWSDAVAFTDPYLRVRQSLLVMVESGIRDTGGTDGHPIGVRSGSSAEECAGNVLPAGADVVAFETVGDLLAALETGSVDGIVQDVSANAELERSDPGAEVVATFDSGEQYGFVVDRARDDGFLMTVDEYLAAIRADGRYTEIYERYFGTAETQGSCTSPES